jgi:hypothetical protein
VIVFAFSGAYLGPAESDQLMELLEQTFAPLDPQSRSSEDELAAFQSSETFAIRQFLWHVVANGD